MGFERRVIEGDFLVDDLDSLSTRAYPKVENLIFLNRCMIGRTGFVNRSITDKVSTKWLSFHIGTDDPTREESLRY